MAKYQPKPRSKRCNLSLGMYKGDGMFFFGIYRHMVRTMCHQSAKKIKNHPDRDPREP